MHRGTKIIFFTSLLDEMFYSLGHGLRLVVFWNIVGQLVRCRADSENTVAITYAAYVGNECYFGYHTHWSFGCIGART